MAEGDPSAALERLEQRPFDLVLTDLRMPGLDGVAFIKRVRALDPEAGLHRRDRLPQPRALDRGARRRRVLVHRQELRPDRRARGRWSRRRSSSGACTARTASCSASSRRATASRTSWARASRCAALLDKVRKVADSEATVLVLGESGTGKELRRARDPLQQPARRAPVRGDQLRRDPRGRCSRASCSATCAARSPARSATGAGCFAAGRRRHALPRRDRRHAARACRPSCCACCRSARSDAWAASAHRARRRADRRRDQPGPRRDDAREALPRRTCTSGSRSSTSRCRRCASGARTSRCWSATSSRCSAAATPTSGRDRGAR